MVARPEGGFTNSCLVEQHLGHPPDFVLRFERQDGISSLRTRQDLVERDVAAPFDQSTTAGICQHHTRRGTLIHDVVWPCAWFRKEMLRQASGPRHPPEHRLPPDKRPLMPGPVRAALSPRGSFL